MTNILGIVHRTNFYLYRTKEVVEEIDQKRDCGGNAYYMPVIKTVAFNVGPHI